MKATMPLALLIAAPAVALAAPPSADHAMAAFDQGRYLAASDELARLAFDRQGRVRDDYSYQMWQQTSAMITGELPIAMLDRARPPAAEARSQGRAWAMRMRRASARDAIAEIVQRARNTDIVILNEAHESPRDRMFALLVARALRPLGYGVLAAETFANDAGGKIMGQLKRDGFVRRGTGFYSRDPVYAHFVRTALAMGYAPAAYEQTDAQAATASGTDLRARILAREQAEAENLEAVIARFPGRKMLVYVGQSHVAEAPIDQSGEGQAKIEWMAARLKRLTGIDPLTVDQATVTDLYAGTRPAQAAVARLLGTRPGVLFEGGKPLVVGQYAGAVDLQVVHPRRSYRLGRPAWLDFDDSKPVPIPAALRPRHGRCLVQAFAAYAPFDAIPLDQVLLKAGHAPPVLMLPPGRVRIAKQCE